jgi:hypothetical protein
VDLQTRCAPLQAPHAYVNFLEVEVNIQKEKWLAIFSIWIDQFETACDLLGVNPIVPASRILELYRDNWRPCDAATLFLSWGTGEN